MLLNADPVGRLRATLMAEWGEPERWRGRGASVNWQRWRPRIGFDAFAIGQHPDAPSSQSLALQAGRDVDLRAAGMRVELEHDFAAWRHRLRAGAGSAALKGTIGPEGRRSSGWAELEGALLWQRDRWSISPRMTLHAEAGRTVGAPFRRGVARAGITLGTPWLRGVDLAATAGEVRGSPHPFEEFAIGGSTPTVADPAWFSQRWAMSMLPTGTLIGPRAASFRAQLPIGIFVPYWWIAGTAARDGRVENWHRVLGADLRFGSAAIPLVSIPSVEAVAGVGVSLDEPRRRRTRGHVSLQLRP